MLIKGFLVKYSIVFAILLMFSGCVIKQPETSDIYDLTSLPQNIHFYTQESNLSRTNALNPAKFEKSYFSPWNIETPEKTLDEIQWAFKSYKLGSSYGENLQLLNQKFFDAMDENANFDAYGSINKKAITLRDLDIRAFPTDRPLLFDPKKAGEGFPFDYLQNTTIAANKPLFISHYSLDGEWAHIFSSFAFGWVKTRDIVLLEKKHTEQWQNAEQVFLLKEGVPLYSQEGNFLFKSKIGMMLPLINEDKDFYTVLAISSLNGLNPFYEKVRLSKNISHKGTIVFNKENFENIVNQVSNVNYGWGGMYGQRDCSSMLRDIYAPFGIWLPRNSFSQAKVGGVISFDGLNDDQKIALIKEEAIPFKTLFYKRGHIMMYVGIVNEQIVALHNVWGIKTNDNGKEGRIVIGKPIFSTLRLGKEQKNYDKNSEILRNLKSMNILEL
jgi:hypothetical protein